MHLEAILSSRSRCFLWNSQVLELSNCAEIDLSAFAFLFSWCEIIDGFILMLCLSFPLKFYVYHVSFFFVIFYFKLRHRQFMCYIKLVCSLRGCKVWIHIFKKKIMWFFFPLLLHCLFWDLSPWQVLELPISITMNSASFPIYLWLPMLAEFSFF